MIAFRLPFAAALLCGIALAGSRASAQTSNGFPPKPPGAPAGPPVSACVGSPDGKIDFRGHLAAASFGSSIQIFTWSDGAQAYVDNLAAQLGPRSAPSTGSSAAPTIADLEAATARAIQVPAVLASASTASFVGGDFSCSGFSSGRYIFLAQVQGGPGQAGVSKSLITYYRADVDVSTVRRRATVVVNGFRRIASYPPQS
ncbi:MAG: hypothetical protein IAI50_10455 [Candidatus Eremiobacteraeota bacterium]|nr:hypothetical protein [Candidatus Eremiobacteraeota bacterium]